LPEDKGKYRRRVLCLASNVSLLALCIGFFNGCGGGSSNSHQSSVALNQLTSTDGTVTSAVSSNESDSGISKIELSQLLNAVVGRGHREHSGLVSISMDGNAIAVGGPHASFSGADSGVVRVFRKEQNQWNQVGSDIIGSLGSKSAVVKLSSDGTRLAVGSEGGVKVALSAVVEVYELSDQEEWLKLGSTIRETHSESWLGSTIAMTRAGDEIAVGIMQDSTIAEKAGGVVIYKWQGDDWRSNAPVLYGENPHQNFGSSIAFSGNDKILAIGGFQGTGNGSGVREGGVVRVFSKEGGTWSQRGKTLFSENPGDRYGRSVALDFGGNLLAVGVERGDKCVADSGWVRVYMFTGNNWEPLGEVICGQSLGEYFGRAVALSDDGQVLVASAPYASFGAGFEEVGEVRFFTLQGQKWVFLNESIRGGFEGSYLSRFAINGDASKIVIGSPFYTDDYEKQGLVRVIKAVYQ
jgi:hypothetical protein